jgi:hypothetical protein
VIFLRLNLLGLDRDFESPFLDRFIPSLHEDICCAYFWAVINLSSSLDSFCSGCPSIVCSSDLCASHAPHARRFGHRFRSLTEKCPVVDLPIARIMENSSVWPWSKVVIER